MCWSIIAAVGRTSSASPVGEELEVQNSVAILLPEVIPHLCLYRILVSLNLVFKPSMSS